MGVFEHRPLLQRALQKTKERLLIISPVITPQVVDREFLSQLETLLDHGVIIYFGFGLGHADQKKELQGRVVDQLKQCANKYDNFTLRPVEDTRAKVLISDRAFGVVTTFNWLSYRGINDPKFRDERGVYFSDPDHIDHLFADCLGRFSGQK